jgi:N-acyl-D-amino-acid deacylase
MTAEAARRYDVLIRGGRVVDGTGAPAFAADVAVLDERIAAVGQLARAEAARTIEAAGRIVAPGFIDAHAHDDQALLAPGDMTPKVSQGVTTVVVGNCGISLAPLALSQDRWPPPLDLLGSQAGFRFDCFAAYAEALRRHPPATNAALLVGHISLRHRTMNTLDRPAGADELAAMKDHVGEAMAAGAVGLSVGLDYPECVRAPTAEVAALAAVAAEHGGIFACHHRDYFGDVGAALEEAFEIGRTSGAPLVVSHHQISGRANFGKSAATLEQIDTARRRQPVALDAYPYAASSKTLDPGRCAPGVRIMVTWSEPHPEAAGRDISEIAAEWGCSDRTAAQRLLPAGAVYFQLDEADVRRILAYEHTMIGSDGLPGDRHPHPRLWGTFPRVLGRYVREVGLFTLEEAVHRMTGLTAAAFGLANRGVLAAGRCADIVVFDPDEIADRATFEAPEQAAAGIDLVMVNGQVTWQLGRPTGARAGRVLRRSTAAGPPVAAP